MRVFYSAYAYMSTCTCTRLKMDDMYDNPEARDYDDPVSLLPPLPDPLPGLVHGILVRQWCFYLLSRSVYA